MYMSLSPLLSSLRHHRLTALLLVAQVALSCAFVTNALLMIQERAARIRIDSGVAEREISLVTVQNLRKDDNISARQSTDLALLRAIPGVTHAVAMGPVKPLSGGAYDISVCGTSDRADRARRANTLREVAGCAIATQYSGSPGFTQALGLRLLAGRDFRNEEFTVSGPTTLAPPVIVTRALAAKLWPGENPLGKQVHGFSDASSVVGVIDNVVRGRLGDPGTDYDVMLVPELPSGATTTYLLRSGQGDRTRILREAKDALTGAGPTRKVSDDKLRTFDQIRHDYFQRDTTMLGLLLASSLALLFVTALGIGGLANFWVGQRTRQIGIRRAVGATRRDILRHFQAENFLIVGAGVVLGML
uniref:FtsX-like permease family protein n=1 Tax=Pseudoxanthomonas winnipegensis TaxID=2480810 RepID=UPI0030F3CCDF